MIINTHDTAVRLGALARSIQKDPASWEGWLCLHYPLEARAFSDENPFPATALSDLIGGLLREVDGTAWFCCDNDIIMICRGVSRKALHNAALSLGGVLGGLCKLPETPMIYEVFEEWRTVETLLESKAQYADAEPGLHGSRHFQGDLLREMDRFAEVFDLSHAQRRNRMPMHVLLVEDDPFTRKIASKVLKNDYCLITAADASEAVANYLLYVPDIVFLDINLPDATGFEVLHSILQCDPDAYVVMFSSNSYLENVSDALNAGAQGFVAKPFRKEALVQYIDDCALARRKAIA